MTIVDPHFTVVAACTTDTYPADLCPPPSTTTVPTTTTTVVTTTPAAHQAGGLPVTGGDIAPLALIGVTAFAIGAVLRRRARRTS